MFNKTILTVYGQRYLEDLAKNPILIEAEFIRSLCDFYRSTYDTFFRDRNLTPPDGA